MADRAVFTNAMSSMSMAVAAQTTAGVQRWVRVTSELLGRALLLRDHGPRRPWWRGRTRPAPHGPAGPPLDWAGESQYSVEPKRFARLGFLEARQEPGRTRPRTVYTLTPKGREALGEYARTPLKVTPVKSEALARRLLDLHLELVDEVERDRGSASCQPPVFARTCEASSDAWNQRR